MVRDPGLEPGTSDVSDRHSTAELIPHGGDGGVRTRVQKSTTN